MNTSFLFIFKSLKQFFLTFNIADISTVSLAVIVIEKLGFIIIKTTNNRSCLNIKNVFCKNRSVTT